MSEIYEKDITVSGGGVGFVGLLTILFVALKLTGVVAWPWLWVLAPLWISFAIGLILIITVITITLLITKY